MQFTAGTAAFCITSCCARIRHFRPINVIDFHNIHLCHLFGGRHLCMLCCSNIVLTFLTRILTKLPKSAHFWLSFEPLEKSSFFQGWMPKHLDTAMVSGGQNSLKAIRKNHKSHNGWKDSKSLFDYKIINENGRLGVEVFLKSEIINVIGFPFKAFVDDNVNQIVSTHVRMKN